MSRQTSRSVVALVLLAGAIGLAWSDAAGQSRPTFNGSRPAGKTPVVTQGVPGPAAQAPTVRWLNFPTFRGVHAIWGGTGVDSRGHMWFGGCCTENIPGPSAHLIEYDPVADKFTDRGDVLSALKACKVYRDGESQMKIHTKITQLADGKLYMATMDEQGEDEKHEKVGPSGGHMLRFDPATSQWEHLLGVHEQLIAAGGTGKYFYAMGYFGHVVYQVDTKNLTTRSVKVGSIETHVTRNILVDGNEHVYVPRVARANGKLTAHLVELDDQLKEIAATPLKNYFTGSWAGSAHGIIGFVPLPDGRIAFTTGAGWLQVIEPSKTGPAKIVDFSYFHPKGTSYASSMFLDAQGRLVGQAQRDQVYEWIVYDLNTRSSTAVAFNMPKAPGPGPDGHENFMVYGSTSKDAAGRFYVVGMANSLPVCLQVTPASRPAGK